MSGSRHDRTRLSPLGAPSGGGRAWLRRIGFATPVVALGWLALAAFRPLPVPQAHEPPAAPSPVKFTETTATMSEREGRLAGVTTGNLFAPDRRAWPQAADGAAPAAGAAAIAPHVEPGSAAPGQAADRTRRGREPGTTAQGSPGGASRPKGLTLRAVYNLGDGPVAIIERAGDKEGPRTERVRSGASTIDGAWDVVRIDEALDEVTVRGEGGEHLLQMYGPNARLLHDEVKANAAATSRDPKATRSEQEVRAELAKAGLSAQEIDELVRLALSDDAADLAAFEAAVAKTEATTLPSEGTNETSPTGLGSILQLMKGDPFGADEEAKARHGGDGEAQERRERVRRARERARSEQSPPQ